MFKAGVMNQTEDRQPVLTIENLDDSFCLLKARLLSVFVMRV